MLIRRARFLADKEQLGLLFEPFAEKSPFITFAPLRFAILSIQ
jgi:hypothetical protein